MSPRSARWVVVAALSLPAFLAVAEDPILPVSKIQPGMKGYGKTVFQGDTIERFDAEIISVVKNSMVKGDMILARLSGGPLKESGLIAGMSGSPVYIDGKLIGAVAYGWTFAKEPIAGITPIEEMLKVAEGVGKNPDPDDTSVGPSPWCPPSMDAFLSGDWWPSPPPREVPAGGQTLPIPVMVTGVSAPTLRFLEGRLEQFGLFPVASGGAAAAPTKPSIFEAGSPLGVQLVRGDVDMVAVGTLTYRKGNKILAFGHSMLQSGEADMPMVAAYVHTVIATQDRSFKLAGSAAPIGRISEDRRPAIGGEIGKSAALIPCTVTVTNAAGARHTYHYEMVRQRLMTPMLLLTVAAESLGATEGMTGDYMLGLHSEVKLAGRAAPLVTDNQFYESGGIGMAFMDAAQKTMSLMNNPFEPVRIEAFNIAVSIRPGRATATIDSITAEKRSVKAGDKARLVVNLRPFKLDKLVAVPFEVELPASLSPGQILNVTATDAATSRMQDRAANPGLYKPETLDQFLALIRREDDNRDLVLRVTMPSGGVSLHGETFPDLPPSMLAILAYGNQGPASPAVTQIVRKHRGEWVLNGSQGLSLVIEQEK